MQAGGHSKKMKMTVRGRDDVVDLNPKNLSLTQLSHNGKFPKMMDLMAINMNKMSGKLLAVEEKQDHPVRRGPEAENLKIGKKWRTRE